MRVTRVLVSALPDVAAGCVLEGGQPTGVANEHDPELRREGVRWPGFVAGWQAATGKGGKPGGKRQARQLVGYFLEGPRQ